MARIPPLAVAAVAGVLLVVVLGVDASMNRTYRLQVEATDGWKTIAEGPASEGAFGPRYAYSQVPIVVADNTSVSFRVTVDNGHPWSFGEPYEVLTEGRVVAAGTVEAPARATGSDSFTLDATRLSRSPYGPEPGFAGDLVYFELRIDGESLYGEILIQEAAS